jgi:hypothetical protein
LIGKHDLAFAKMVPRENARDLGLDCALTAKSAFGQSDAVGRNCKLG